MKRIGLLRTGAMATSSVLALSGGAAFAQSAPTAETSVSDIVVTAQKREERLQDVPIAITAITSNDLEPTFSK